MAGKTHPNTTSLQKRNVTVAYEESFYEYECINVYYTWDIFDFSVQRSEITSPEFRPELHNHLAWALCVDPCHKVASKLFVSVQLRRSHDKNKTDAHVMELSILKRDGSKAYTKKTTAYRFNPSWGPYVDLIERDILLNNEADLLFEDKLTLACELSLRVNKAPRASGDRGNIIVPECQLENDLERLLDNEMGCDVTLSTGFQELRAHKAILMARSSVLAAMLQDDMNERNAGCVMITDTSHEVLCEMLRFIYTGRKPQKERMNSELLVAADKYGLQRLKTLCEEALSSTISVDTAAERLCLADKHNAEQLKMRAVDYIMEHSSDVLLTDGWKAVMESQSHLADGLISILCRRLDLLKPR